MNQGDGTDGATNRSVDSRPAIMVQTQIEARGIEDPRVLAALRAVPRHCFVPPDLEDQAYEDRPLAIGLDQTISQPYIVGLMTELVRPRPGANVLEIGTGSGYQAAVLAECGCRVHSVEIVPELSRRAAAVLHRLGYDGVALHTGDGFDGWPAEAPYDGILVAAAPLRIPQPLLDQLAAGGRLVIPVGLAKQDLLVITRGASGFERWTVAPVRFVPMTGRAAE